MKYFFRIFVAAAVLAACFSAAPVVADDAKPKNEVVEQGWTSHCDKPATKDAPKYCEVANALVMKDSHMQVATFAVGFPDKNSKTARGAVVLPLGILVQQDVIMNVDDSKTPFTFRVQYCTPGGCFSYINLSPAVIEDMKKGSKAHFSFAAVGPQKIDIAFSLSGFGKTMKGIQ